MDRGLVQQRASPYDIYHRPANLFVAEFIGDPRINRLEGSFGAVDDQQGIQFEGLWLALDRDPPAVNGSVIATVRPEDVRLSKSEKQGWLKTRLDSVLPTGADTVLQASSEHGNFTLLQPGFFEMSVDEFLWLSFESRSLNFFDAGSGRNLLP